MTVLRGWNFLQTPGPTNIPNRILNAMHRPAVEFAGPDFRNFATELLQDLKALFQTNAHVFLYSANGHGAWEAAVKNVLAPNDKVLVPGSGQFSEGWAKMARSNAIETIELPCDWRTVCPAADITQALMDDKTHSIKAVMAVQTDTGTGMTTDIKAVRQAIDDAQHPALLLVDTIASLMTIDFRMDDWGVDVAVAAGQKGLMLPPGISFTAASERALNASHNGAGLSGYWDWQARQGQEHYLWFCGTAPEHLMFGLRESINMLHEEGFENVFARHERLSAAVRAAVNVWAEAGALELNALNQSQQSNSVSTILVNGDHDVNRIFEICRERFNVALGNGLGRLSEKSFRIGHMGDLNEPMILGALASVEAALQLANIPIKSGGVTAAIDHLLM